MHDLHLANQILKVFLEYSQKNKFLKVTGVLIELGEIVEHGSEISAENLDFNLKMLARDTLANGFEVKVNKIKSNNWVLKEIIGE
jgi:Zn finger protein HypA/HybF involved in hydrogenase expression